MRFTKYNSLNDILTYPLMREYLKIFYSDYLLGMFPIEMADEPLALLENFGKTPWNDPFSIVVDQLLDAANMILDFTVNETRECISLWYLDKKAWTLEEEIKRGKNQVFLLSPRKGKEEKTPAVIICPGGGYEEVCFSGEGNPMLHYMESQGYRAFILRYRVAPNRYPAPQTDLALAIQYVRANADDYGVDPSDIMVLGASAGGHLCALQGAMHEESKKWVTEEFQKENDIRIADYEKISARPNKLCLCYPVISFLKEQHEGSFQALTGGAEEKRECLSIDNLVTPDYPQTFVWACEDDDCVPASNAKRIVKVLKENQIKSMLCIYPSGGHGCALAFSKEAFGWSREMVNFMKQ